MMRWVESRADEKAHAVFREDAGHAICGMPVEGTTVVDGVVPEERRCRNCDAEWRWRGREQAPRRKVDRRTLYRPRLKIEDWERLG